MFSLYSFLVESTKETDAEHKHFFTLNTKTFKQGTVTDHRIHKHVHEFFQATARLISVTILTVKLGDIGEVLRHGGLENFKELWEFFNISNNSIISLHVLLGQI